MKLIIEIDDHRAPSFMKLIKELSYIKAFPLSMADAELLEEVKGIKQAFNNAQKIKPGISKSKPVDQLVNSLKASNYQQNLITVSTWTDDDLKAYDEVRKDFGNWKSIQWQSIPESLLNICGPRINQQPSFFKFRKIQSYLFLR